MKSYQILFAAVCLGTPTTGAAYYAEAVPIILAQADSGDAQDTTSLTKTEWRVLQLNGKDVVEGVTSTLTFGDEGAVYGSGGCNRFRGSVEIKGATMKFGPLASTMMACEEEKSRQEALFHAAMEQTTSYALEEGELTLIDAGGTKVARLGKP